MSKLIVDPSFYSNRPQAGASIPAGSALQSFPSVDTGHDNNVATASNSRAAQGSGTRPKHLKHDSDDTYGGYSDEFFSYVPAARGVTSVGGASANSQTPSSQEWVIPRRIMCSFFWIGIILLFTGIVLMVTSKHQKNG